MRLVVIIIILSFSKIFSQWEMGIEYSLSKQNFENIDEWRVYQGEIQVHIDGVSYFFDERNFKLLDEVEVLSDSIINTNSNSSYEDYNVKLQVTDYLFDKKYYKCKGSILTIFNEKNNDTIKVINMRSNIYYTSEDIYLVDDYFINSIYDNIIIFNNAAFAVWEPDGKSMYRTQKPIILRYNLNQDEIIKSQIFYGGIFDYFSLFQLNENDSNPSMILNSNNNLIKYITLEDSITKSLNIKNFNTKDKTLSLNSEYLYDFKNYKFNINNLVIKNQYIDTNLLQFKPILIQELKANIFLMKSDSIGYFTYDLITQNVSIIKNLNELNKIFEFKNPKLNLKNNNFYAETNQNKIIRISLSSFINNLISVDFTVDKNLADSNHVFKFVNNIDGEVDSLLWDFGDGISSTEANPKHKYEISGKYDIKLTSFKNGNEISNIKKEFVYIPTPVRLNVNHSITINENDATIYVTNGATGSNLKHTLIHTVYPFLSGVPDIMIDTINAGSFSFKTNKSFFTKSFEFIVSNELYSASQRLYLREHEFDFWSDDILEEVNLRKTSPGKDEKNFGITFLVHNKNHLPIIVNESEDLGIIIDNLQGVNNELVLKKKLKAYTNHSFITDDAYLYNFSLKNFKNVLDSISLLTITNNEQIYFYDNLNEDEFIIATSDSLFIIDNDGNLLQKFLNPKRDYVFIKLIENKYIIGEKNKNNRIYNFIIYDSDFNLVNQFKLPTSQAIGSNAKFYSTIKSDTLKIIFAQSSKTDIFEINMNSKAINIITNTYQNYLSSNFINNKLFVVNNKHHIEAIGDGWFYNYNSNFILFDENQNELYNYTLNERPGPIIASTFVNDNFYIYGLIRKPGGFRKTFFKIDLNDKLLLSVKPKISGIFSMYPNPAKDKIKIETNEIISNIKIIDLLGKVVFQSEAHLTEIDVSQLQRGVYNLIINNQHSMKFVKE